MDSNITNITVDLATTNNFGIVKAMQGDRNTRFVHITLLDNQVEYDFTNVYPVLRGTKPDGTTIFNKCSVSAENRIIVQLTKQLLAEPGISTYEIALYATPNDLTEEKRVITSFPFTLLVNKAAFDPKAVTSTDEFTAIADVIGNNAFLQGCLDDIAASRDAAKVSENNARASEINAKNSETAARDSENAARISENNAKVSENNARDSETAAKSSETNAKDSENKAKASETAARDSETAARTSETNAKTSETNAKDSETAAKTSETNAKDSEDKAKASETAAKASETASQNSYLLSKSYAVGTDNVTRPDDATDNSKYYSEQSKEQATASAASAAAAAGSENTATQKAEESADSAVLSRSWAVGDTDSRSGETTDNAKYYSEQSKTYADSWKGSLLPKGTIPFNQLPTSDTVAGHMYHIQDAFETDSRFRDGAGYAYPAGTNVYWTVDGKWDCLSGVLTMELTMAEYNALTQSQKMNGTIYYISDADNSIQMATQNYDGLMSHMDKEKLDGMETGATRVIVDDAVSETSENAVQNKAITNALNTRVTDHNTSPDSHTDIRDLISALTARLNTLADSDDTTLDQLSEIVAYIKSNRSLIEKITTDGVSVLDIVDSLTSTAADKPLSANQGMILNELVTTLTSTVRNKVDKVSGKTLSTNDYTTADKDKLSGIENGANAYSLPQATESVRGGVKVGYAQNGNNIPVQLNADEQMYVNINLKPEDINAPKNSECDCFGICNTPKTNGTKVVTVSGNFSLTPGARVWVQFPNGSKLNDGYAQGGPEVLKLNVNDTGAKRVDVNGGYIGNSGFKDPIIPEGGIYEFIYNGNNWIISDSLAGAAYYSKKLNGPVLTAYGPSGDTTETHLIFSGCAGALYTTRNSNDKLDWNPDGIEATTYLGTNSHPWHGIYTTRALNIVSDAKRKHNIEDLEDTYLKLFDHLQIKRYILNGGADTLTRTKNQRYHLGVIAQDVENTVRSVGFTSNDFSGVCSEYFAHYGSYVQTIHGGWRAPADDKSYSNNVYNWKHRNETNVEPYEVYNEIIEEPITGLHIDNYRKNIGYIMIEDNSKLTKEQPSVTINSISFLDSEGNITSISFTDFLRYYNMEDADFMHPLSDVVLHKDGSATISFNRMYGCAWLKLSEVIDITKFSSVIIDVDYIGEYTVVFIPDGEYQNANPYDRDRNDQILYDYSFRYDELFALTSYALQETRKEFNQYKKQTDVTIKNLVAEINYLAEKVEKKYDGN